MKLTVEEKKELAQLSGYFKKLEITTQHQGMELDDLISEYRDNGFAQFPEQESGLKTSRRKETFQKVSGKKDAEKAKSAKVK